MIEWHTKCCIGCFYQSKANIGRIRVSLSGIFDRKLGVSKEDLPANDWLALGNVRGRKFNPIMASYRSARASLELKLFEVASERLVSPTLGTPVSSTFKGFTAASLLSELTQNYSTM